MWKNIERMLNKEKDKNCKNRKRKSKECEELRQHFDQKFMDGKVKKKKVKKINTFPYLIFVTNATLQDKMVYTLCAKLK